MQIANARRDPAARKLMIASVDDAEHAGFAISFVSTPCCNFQGSHCDSIGRTIHVLDTEGSGAERRQRSERQIAISLAHEVGHALDPPTDADHALTEPHEIDARRIEREATAWRYVETTVERLDVGTELSDLVTEQRERAETAYDEFLGRQPR